MLDPSKLRAARAMLKWSRDDMAEATGLHARTIKQIEDGKVQPHQATEEALYRVLDENQIEITRRGVQWRDDIVRKFEGENHYLTFLNEVHRVMLANKDPNKDVLFVNVDDSVSTPEVVNVNNRMREDGIGCRYLCKDHPRKLDHPIELYRAVPENFYKNGLLVVYGDYLAVSIGLTMVLVIHNDAVAESVKYLFEIVWSQSKQPVLKK